VRRLPFTDHAPLSRLFHPSLQHGGFHVSEPWQATLFLLRLEVDGFLPFRSISPTATWQTSMPWPMPALRHKPPLKLHETTRGVVKGNPAQ
jgi:hypothetical protein